MASALPRIPSCHRRTSSTDAFTFKKPNDKTAVNHVCGVVRRHHGGGGAYPIDDSTLEAPMHIAIFYPWIYDRSSRLSGEAQMEATNRRLHRHDQRLSRTCDRALSDTKTGVGLNIEFAFPAFV